MTEDLFGVRTWWMSSEPGQLPQGWLKAADPKFLRIFPFPHCFAAIQLWCCTSRRIGRGRNMKEMPLGKTAGKQGDCWEVQSNLVSFSLVQMSQPCFSTVSTQWCWCCCLPDGFGITFVLAAPLWLFHYSCEQSHEDILPRTCSDAIMGHLGGFNSAMLSFPTSPWDISNTVHKNF